MTEKAGGALIDGSDQSFLQFLLEMKVHIGGRSKTDFMMPFIYRVVSTGVAIFNLDIVLERIKVAAKFIARYEPKDVLVHSRRPYACRPIEKFAELTGVSYVTGRLLPGSLTNYELPYYIEPRLLLVADPRVDAQAVEEASKVGIPVIALCDTSAVPEFVDLVIPCNNKGRTSLAAVFWSLAYFVLRERGVLKEGETLGIPPQEFVAEIAPLEM